MSTPLPPPDVSADPMGKPLIGHRVIELAQWVAGPAVGGLMADWGADVIKVEAPTGDPQRNMFAAVGIEKDIPNPAFAQDNRGKRSVVLDLQSSEGRARLEQLLASADVFVTNLRPGALERLDLSATAVQARHPSLVVAAQSGYGPEGPARDVAGYDIGAFVSRTGIARTNSPEAEPPINLRSAIGDHATAMATTMGVLAKLLERSKTGRGGIVESSLYQTGLYLASWDLSIQLTFGRLSRMRPRHLSTAPLVNSYQSSDHRWFYLIGLEAERHFPGLCAAIERPDLLEDPRFERASGILKNAPELIVELDAVFATRTLDDWSERFDTHDVWWAPCQTMAEVAEDPQALALGLFLPTDAPGNHPENIRTVAGPLRFDGVLPVPPGPVPALGQHTDEVLEELDRMVQ